MEVEAFPRAEEALRLLAAAAGAARLYPPASALPREAAERFASRTNALTTAGPLRYTIDPHGVRIGDAELASGQSQVTSLAESLHALQVGQLVIAPGVSQEETEAFVSIANADPAIVRAGGGTRTQLALQGVRHMAVIEVSLRSSDESGLLGVDLTTAPLDEIASEVARAVEDRAAEAASGAAHDDMAEAIERLEEATRELAMERVASAMMLLDETTRMRVLSVSLASDSNGQRMEGMLAVLARMKPAALARLLSLVATQVGTDPRRIAAAMTLPPETAQALALMLSTIPDLTPGVGTPDFEPAENLAAEMAVEDDRTEIMRQVAAASPSLASGRALATAIAVSRVRLDVGTVQAIGEVLPAAARDGSFSTVREAIRRLDEIATDPRFADAVTGARTALAVPDVLRDVCRAASTDADAAIAGEILHSAGTIGAEALLDCYTHMDSAQRSLVQPVLRGSRDVVLGVARSRLRRAPTADAIAIVQALSALGDRHAVTVIAETLDSSLDEQVRFAAASTLARMSAPEAIPALIKALGHREVETQRHVVRELGRMGVPAAVGPLVRHFDDLNVLVKSHQMRKEIITALGSIDTPEARKALARFATRYGFGRKSRELKRLAARTAGPTPRQGVDVT